MMDGHEMVTAEATQRRGLYSRVGAALLACWMLLWSVVPCSARPAPDLSDILTRYNAAIVYERTAVESLRVVQTMIEPQEDGSTRTSEAILAYTRSEGMKREEVFSEITHPAGEYTLDSLIGPELWPDEYDLECVGVDTMADEEAYHLTVTATVRDRRHFDGDVWISASDFTLVRITGRVADPPFPVTLITLDKSFQPGPQGLRLLRRHSGEVEVDLLLGTKRGLRHIFYDDYRVSMCDER